MGCKGKCTNYSHAHFGNSPGGTQGSYDKGWKRDAECEYWTKTSRPRCNCCGRLYRFRPSTSKLKSRLREIIKTI